MKFYRKIHMISLDSLWNSNSKQLRPQRHLVFRYFFRRTILVNQMIKALEGNVQRFAQNLNFLCGFKWFSGGALSESVLETTRKGLQVSHSSGSGRSPPLRFLAPFIWRDVVIVNHHRDECGHLADKSCGKMDGGCKNTYKIILVTYNCES